MTQPPSLSRLLGAPVADARLDLDSVERSANASGLQIRVLVPADRVGHREITRFAAYPRLEFVLCPTDLRSLHESLREFDATSNVSACVEVRDQASVEALIPLLLDLPVRRRYVALRVTSEVPNLGQWLYTSCACGVYDGTPMRDAPAAGCGTCGRGGRREVLDAVYLDDTHATRTLRNALAAFAVDLSASKTPLHGPAR